MKKTIVIAAAGKGSRLGADLPKCLVEVNGHMIFEYLLEAFAWADEIRMVIGYKSEEVINRVSALYSNIIFIENSDYATTTTLQSNYLGVRCDDELVMFVDGDMILSKQTVEKLCFEYDKHKEFIGVATDISEDAVFAGVENGKVIWFDYNKKATSEWANVALIDAEKIEYNHTHFFVQLQKFLPMNAFEIERLEIDTPSDLKHAEKVIQEHPDKYYFWEDK